MCANMAVLIVRAGFGGCYCAEIPRDDNSGDESSWKLSGSSTCGAEGQRAKTPGLSFTTGRGVSTQSSPCLRPHGLEALTETSET